MSSPCKRGVVDNIYRQNSTELTVKNKTRVVSTTKGNQNEFQKDEQY